MSEVKRLKIWEARLQLFMNRNDDYELRFVFEPAEGEYKKHETDYWELDKHWVANSIPIKMTVNKFYSTYTVCQGFEKELTPSQLDKVQKAMKRLLSKKLLSEKKEFMHYHNKKLESLKGELD